MTAAVLQFNQHIRQTHTSNQSQSPSNNQSDYIDTPMTKEYHQIMIDLLNTEHPFKAVRLAEEFNRENGFELIPIGMIRKWKKEISFLGIQKAFSVNQIPFSVNQNENSHIKSEKTKFKNNQDSENEKLEIKIQLEEGYRQLLGIEK